MENKKTPYLEIWKQVLLTAFTLGIWTYVWRSRMITFTNQLLGEKRDAETQSLLTFICPPLLIPMMVRLAKALNSDKTENAKEKGYKGISLKLILTLQIISIALTVSLIVMSIVLMIVFKTPIILILFSGLIILSIAVIPNIAFGLPITIIMQKKINELAEIEGIEARIPYSMGAVQSPYKSIGVFITLSILTVGTWTAFSWISSTTGFLNRVSDKKRNKLDETLLCALVPGYYYYWANKSAKLVDDFSAKMQNEEYVSEKIRSLSKIGYGIVTYPVLAVLINAKIQSALNKDVYMRRVDSEGILEIRNLRKCFPIGKTLLGTVTRELNAVKNASFVLKQGETLGIVGESGCGKTTMGRTILKLYPSEEGQIIFNGYDITHCPKSQTRKMRKDMQIIFQDPYSSLPPRSTVGGILTEPIQVHKIVPKAERKEYVLELMDKCGLRDYYYERYPHEFSGGQRQRICIARALSVNPKLVICDEPVSALDVSIQAQIINLLKDLQKNMGLTYLFISHDLSVVKYISDKIGVMYLGTMMEFGRKEDIFSNPLHPYTKALFSAIPNPNPDVKMKRIPLTGDIPSPADPPKGCSFHTRCPYAMDICKKVTPQYVEHEPGHFAACHLINKTEENIEL